MRCANSSARVRRSGATVAAALLTLATLGGCTQITNIGGDPFVTREPQYLPDADRQDYVSICYNADTTTRADIEVLAAKSCVQPGSTVKFFSHDMIFNDCPIVTKARVTFLCVIPVP
jgi:hypothetical protein